MEHPHQDPGEPSAGRVRSRWAYFLVAWAGLVGLDALVYRLIRRKGVHETGDEPHYLVVARAVSHWTPHPLQAYEADIRTHQLFAWPAGIRPTNLALQLYTGPHGPVSEHPIGLAVILAPFVAAGGATMGRGAVMAMGAAGIVYFFHRAARLTGLGLRARVVFALLLGGPALWLAATQIYPDFLSGVVLACVLVDVVGLERRMRLDRVGVAASAAGLAVLPWLHQQNLAAALIAVGALLLLGWRARRFDRSGGGWGAALIITGVAVASWLLLLAFNLYAYGHAEGLPQPFPTLNGAGVTEILGLFVDRHQGMFVQLPTAVVALAGMWVARRWAPVALVATVLGALSLIYLNGTFIHAPYGGLSFAGRFQWSSLLPLLIWCPPAVAAFDRVGRRAWWLGGGALLLWVLQAEPLWAGHHLYYNQQLLPGDPWDPAGYPGWWGPLDRVLPVLAPGGRLFGQPWFGILVACVLLGALLALVLTGYRPGRATATAAVSLSSLIAVAAVVVILVGPTPLPSRPLVFPGADVASPLVTGPAPATAPVPLVAVLHGTFLVTVDYRVDGPAGSAVQSYCRSGPSRTGGPAVTADLASGAGTATIRLTCPKGTLWFESVLQPGTTLIIGQVQVRKLAAG